MDQLILFLTNIWKAPKLFKGTFHFFPNLHPPAVTFLAYAVFVKKKNLFAFVARKTAPAPSVLPLFVLLIPIIVKIFYDQSKLDVFLIHEIRQKTAGTCRGRPLTQKRGAKMGPIGTRVRPSGKS